MAAHREFLDTAIEVVARAGDLQMERFGQRDMQIDKKGAIDLVTEVDVAVERMFRELIATRFPDHHVLAEEFGGSAAVPPGPCWVFDPIDGTTNFAHGIPIFCASLALEIDGVAQVAAVFDPTRQELFTAERGRGAFLNGRPIAVSAAAIAGRRGARHGLSVRRARARRRNRRPVRAISSAARARCARLGSAAIDLCYVAAGRMDGFWESGLKPWDIAGGALIVEEAGGRVTHMDGDAVRVARRSRPRHKRLLHEAMLEVIASFRSSRL